MRFWTSSKFRKYFHRGGGACLQKWWPEPGWWLFRRGTSLLLILWFRFLVHRLFNLFQVGTHRYLAGCVCCRWHWSRTRHRARHHFQLTPLENFLSLLWESDLILRESWIWQWSLWPTKSIVWRLEWHVQFLDLVHFLIILIFLNELVISLAWIHSIVLEILFAQQANAATR